MNNKINQMNRLCVKKKQLCLLFTVTIIMTGVSTAFGQALSSSDSLEKVRFAKVIRAVSSNGYTNCVVVGRGDSTADQIFVLTATRKESGVIVVVAESNGKMKVHPVELETGKTPADIGIRGISVSKFFDVPEVYDIVVTHSPFMLETSYKFDIHHLVRFGHSSAEKICEFRGSSSSTSSKGMRSVSSTRNVTIEKIIGGKSFRFKVTSVEENSEQNDGKDPSVNSRNETFKEYEVPATGPCKELMH